MGGYHVAHRATNNSNYIGINSTLKLPDNCEIQEQSSSTVNDGVFPEFFHGFYKGSYGIDVGVIYAGDETFKLCHWSNAITCKTADDRWGEKEINVSRGDTIQLKTYLNGNNITIEAWKNSIKVDSLDAPLSSGAVQTFSGGAKINREITMASNRYPYIPSDAYFSDTTFSRSTLTTTSYSYEKLRLTNSEILRYADDGVTMDGNRYGYVTPVVEDSDGYVIDTGSCDFRPK